MASAPPPEYQEKGNPPLESAQPLLQDHHLSKPPPPYPADYPPESGSSYPPQPGPGYPQAHPVQSANAPASHPGYPPQGHQGYPPQGYPGYPPQGYPGYQTQGQPGEPPKAQTGYPPQGHPGQPIAVSYAVGAQSVVVQPGEPAPNDYLCFSIFNILCCCCCFGIVALTKSLAVRRHLDHGLVNEARRSSSEALKWNKISLGVGIVILLCWIGAIIAINVLNFRLFSLSSSGSYSYGYN